MLSESRIKEIEKDIFDFDSGEVFNLDLVDFVENTRDLMRERKQLVAIAEAASECPEPNCDIHYHPTMKAALKAWKESK